MLHIIMYTILYVTLHKLKGFGISFIYSFSRIFRVVRQYSPACIHKLTPLLILATLPEVALSFNWYNVKYNVKFWLNLW